YFTIHPRPLRGRAHSPPGDFSPYISPASCQTDGSPAQPAPAPVPSGWPIRCRVTPAGASWAYQPHGARPMKLVETRATRRARPAVEGLEARVVPYAVSGNARPNPQFVTLSFVPDGTNLGGFASNLFAVFNASWSHAVWQTQIPRAAQAW